MHQILCSRNLIMMNLEQEIKYLKEQKIPIEEIRLLEILKKEEEWNLLSKKEKQNKRKFAISFLERESHKNRIKWVE